MIFTEIGCSSGRFGMLGDGIEAQKRSGGVIWKQKRSGEVIWKQKTTWRRDLGAENDRQKKIRSTEAEGRICETLKSSEKRKLAKNFFSCKCRARERERQTKTVS